MFELVFLSGPRAGAIIAVSGTQRAGRSPECEIEIPDPNVSRHHGQFVYDGVSLHLVDQDSSNGCFVNDQRIEDEPLNHGDTVRFGETRLRVQRRSRKTQTSDVGSRSSVFGFKDVDSDADLSQSLSLSMLKPVTGREQNADGLEQRLNAIMWVAEQLASIAKLDELYGPVLDTLFEVFPHAERSFLMLGNEYENLTPKAMRIRGKSDATLAANHNAVSSTLCRQALLRKDLIVYQEGANTDFDQGMSIVSLNIRSAMVVPLIVKEEVLGLLVVDTSDRSRSFTEQDMELAAAVCRQIAIALKNALLLEQMAEETKTRNNLMRFLPKPVVDQAVSGALDLRLGGSTCHGTIFYADVVGFTRMSEQMSPEAVIGMMNGFFNRMVPCIEAMGGAIDKFMGDCIMAFWGVPFSQEDSCIRAAAAGLNMQNGLVGLNSLRVQDGEPELGMGIGMDAGQVVAGNIGSEDRVEYTVLGNTVNTAQRIQSQANRNQVLLGTTAFKEGADSLFAVQMPPVQVKNKLEPVTTYSVRGVVLESEAVLHVPVLIGDVVCVISRRLSEGGFILIHPSDVDPDGQEMTLNLRELPPRSIGSAKVVERMSAQEVDGLLARTQIAIEDPSLGGLLSETTLVTDLSWDEMMRSTS
ncbi:MAG: FHA domain-containing protein [Planctomycetota bacterium]|jgi:adenylate cyclase|nr:FHA domain-containing protein [Planctomycetota bacterium]